MNRLIDFRMTKKAVFLSLGVGLACSQLLAGLVVALTIIVCDFLFLRRE